MKVKLKAKHAKDGTITWAKREVELKLLLDSKSRLENFWSKWLPSVTQLGLSCQLCI